MYELCSPAKNFTTFATSSGVPILRNGMFFAISSFTSCFKTSVICVSINPGATAFARMLRDANSFAILFVKPIIPAFEAA